MYSVRTETRSAEEHLAHIAARAQGTGLVSALQVPGWAAVKSDWRNESLGWFDGGSLVGAGLVLCTETYSTGFVVDDLGR